MTAALLHRILNKIESYDNSPLVAQRAIWRVARGLCDDNPRDLAHDTFDWFCEFSKTELPPDEQKLIDANPDDIEDETERKQFLRRQRKALKRAQSKNRTFTSKVSPEIISIVELLLKEDNVKAADILFFLAAAAPLLTPKEIADLYGRISPCVVAAAPLGGIVRLNKICVSVVEGGEIFESKVDGLEALFWFAHGPIGLKDKTVSVKDMVASLSGIDGNPYWDHHKIFCNQIGVKPKAIKIDVFDEAADWERLAKILPIEYKVAAKYSAAHNVIDKCVKSVERKRLPGQKFGFTELFDEADRLFKLGDFEIPAKGYIDEEIEGVLVQTITTSEELRANGTYMGNCTYSAHHKTYKNGVGILFKLTYDGAVYNTDVRPTANGSWRVQETKGRHNSTNIPDVVKAANKQICERLST